MLDPNPNSPRDVNELKSAMNKTIDYKVPAERKSGAFAAIGLAIATLFFTLFIFSFSELWGMMITYIIMAFSLFGWDPILTSIFMSLVFLAVTVMLYIASKRGNDAASTMEAGLKISFNIPPTRFYDLSGIPAANLIRELVGSNNPKKKDRGRGCILTPHADNVGFDITCNGIPDTKEMKALKEGKIEALEWKEKTLIILFFAIWGGLQAAVTFTSMLAGIYMYIAWILFLIAFFIVMIETRIFRLWSTVIAWLGFCILFTFIVADVSFVWTIWGSWICSVVAATIFYVVFKDSCVKKEAWYCDFM